MSRSGPDLAQLLAGIDPTAPLAQRHLQLIAVLDWVRGGMRKTPDQWAAQLRHLAADCQKVAVERASGTL